MVCEAAGTGTWSRSFSSPNLTKFDEPTVEGVDYPSLGIRYAWNDDGEGCLLVGTCVGTPSMRGVSTSFQVSRLSQAEAVVVHCDGQPFSQWRVVEDGIIEIDTEIMEHDFRIMTRGDAIRPREAGATRTSARPSGKASSSQSEDRSYVPASPGTCSCCASG